jgi:hypothetical protein
MASGAHVKYLAFAVPLAAALSALALWLVLPPGPMNALMAEASIVETLTLFAYGAAIAAVGLALRGTRDRMGRVAILLVLVFLGAREMDLHIRLTGTSVLRFSYFFQGAFSGEKAGALAAVATILACMGYLWWRYRRVVWHGVRTGQPGAWLVLAFFVTGILAKALDRSVSILAHDFGITVTRNAAALVHGMEETLELSLPLLVALAAVQYLRAAKPFLGHAARPTRPEK